MFNKKSKKQFHTYYKEPVPTSAKYNPLSVKRGSKVLFRFTSPYQTEPIEVEGEIIVTDLRGYNGKNYYSFDAVSSDGRVYKHVPYAEIVSVL